MALHHAQGRWNAFATTVPTMTRRQAVDVKRWRPRGRSTRARGRPAIGQRSPGSGTSRRVPSGCPVPLADFAFGSRLEPTEGARHRPERAGRERDVQHERPDFRVGDANVRKRAAIRSLRLVMLSLSASNFLSKRSAIASILSRTVRTSALMSATSVRRCATSASSRATRASIGLSVPNGPATNSMPPTCGQVQCSCQTFEA